MLPMDTIIDVCAYTGSDDPEHEDEILFTCTLQEFFDANADEIDAEEMDDIRQRMQTNPAHVIGGGAAGAFLLCLPMD